MDAVVFNVVFFFFQAEDGIRDRDVTGVQTCALPILSMTGYQVQDLVPEVAIRPTADDPTFYAMLQASQQMDIVFGFVHEDTRQRFYTSAAYLRSEERRVGKECIF